MPGVYELTYGMKSGFGVSVSVMKLDRIRLVIMWMCQTATATHVGCKAIAKSHVTDEIVMCSCDCHLS